MPYTPIVGTLGFVLSPDRTETLMVHRIGRPHDESFGKWNGLGGKLEPNEDIAAGMRRELTEEAGITDCDLDLRGTVSWPGFGPNGEAWLGFIFTVSRYCGEPFTENEEGPLHWVSVNDVLAGRLPMWAGDQHFLPLVFDDDRRPFHGVMPYSDGQPVSWSYSR